MRLRLYLLSLCSSFLLLAQPAHAEFDYMIELGLHSGGDTLETVPFEDGSTEDIEGGKFFSLNLGIAWDMGESIESRFNLGIKYDTVDGNNGSVDFSRYISHFLLFYKVGNWRLGGGYAYHWDIELDGSGVASDASYANARYDDASGYVAQIDYYFTENAYVGIQYTDIEYDRLTDFGKTARTFDASSTGIVVGGRF